MEDWEAEAKAHPEPTFNFPSSTPTLQQQQRPKQSFLRYLKTVHGRETAAKVRSQLTSKNNRVKFPTVEGGIPPK